MVYLSDFYKYFEQFHLQGHSIGRKLGDLLEIITNEYLNHKLGENITIKNEKPIDGYSGASHRVEFKLCDSEKMVGLAECKRVGAEVTIAKVKFPLGDLNIFENRIRFTSNIIENRLQVTLRNLTNNQRKKFEMKVGEKFQIAHVEGNDGKINLTSEHIIAPTENISKISGKIRKIRIFVLTSLNPLKFAKKIAFPHPATIEKAKQIGFVSLDVRKKELGIWGKDDLPKGVERRFISILFITELSHWDEKSILVINSSMDYVLVLLDEIWIDLVRELINRKGLNDFTEVIKMKFYREGKVIKEITQKICEKYNYNIFTDINGAPKNINYYRGKIVVQ